MTAAGKRPASNRWVRRVGVATLAVVAVEVVARFVAGHAIVIRPEEFLALVRVCPSGDLFELVPGAEVGDYRINHAGFRGGALHSSKPDLRIICMGNSVMFGVGIRDDAQTLPGELRRLLTEQTGRTVEVLNGAVPAYNTEFERLAIERGPVLGLAPDALVLGWAPSDIDVHVSLVNGQIYPPWVDPGTPLTGLAKARFVWTFLIESSPLLSFMRSLFESGDPDAQALDELDRIMLGSAWEGMKGDLIAIDTLLRSKGVPWMVVLFPMVQQVARSTCANPGQADLVAFLQDQAIPAVDLCRAFAMPPLDEVFLNDGIHLRRRGVQVAAGEILPALVSLLDSALPRPFVR